MRFCQKSLFYSILHSTLNFIPNVKSNQFSMTKKKISLNTKKKNYIHAKNIQLVNDRHEA